MPIVKVTSENSSLLLARLESAYSLRWCGMRFGETFLLFYDNPVVTNQLICFSVTSFYRLHYTMSRDSIHVNVNTFTTSF